MDLQKIIKVAEVLNKDKEAFTDDINVCYDVVKWYK
jgi:hypothetical protein